MTETLTHSFGEGESEQFDPIKGLEDYIVSKLGGNREMVSAVIKYSVSLKKVMTGTEVQDLLKDVEREKKDLLGMGKAKIDKDGKPIIKLNKRKINELRDRYGLSYEDLKGMDPEDRVFPLLRSEDIVSGMDNSWNQMNTEFNHWWKEVSRIQSEIKRLEYKKAAWQQYDKTWNREPMLMARDMSKPIPEQFTSADQTRLTEELPSDLRRAQDKKNDFRIKMEVIEEAKKLTEEYFKNRFYKTGKVGI